jgi:VCBS repeat-containing protein
LGVSLADGVLKNDTDPDGDVLTAGSASTPGQGSVLLNADGSFTYTPNAGAAGTDTFTYEASDGVLSSPATVTITITP